MASHKTVEITTITEISQRRMSLPRTSHGDRTRGLPGAQPDKATDGDVYQMTAEKPMDIIPKRPTEMVTEKSIKNATKKDSLQTKLKPNRITCRIREITITIPNHDYTATEPRWQSTIDIIISRRRSNEHFKKGEIAVSTQ